MEGLPTLLEFHLSSLPPFPRAHLQALSLSNMGKNKQESKDAKPPAKGGKANKGAKGGSGGKGGGDAGNNSADAKSKSTKMKGAMSINVRHILVRLV